MMGWILSLFWSHPLPTCSLKIRPLLLWPPVHVPLGWRPGLLWPPFPGSLSLSMSVYLPSCTSHTAQPTPGLGFLFSKSQFCLPLPLLIQLKVKAQDRAHSREPHMDARRAETLHPQSSQQSLRPRLLGQRYHKQALSRPS